MKTFLTLLTIITITHYRPSTKVNLTIKILPELLGLSSNQPIDIDIRSKDISFNSSKIIKDSLVLQFETRYHSSLSVTLAGSFKYSDGSERFFWTGQNFPVTSNPSKIYITFPKNCPANKYLGGKTCPQCKQVDKVIPILWGLPSPIEKGIAGVDYIDLGCVRSSCDPSWYCRRDSLEF